MEHYDVVVLGGGSGSQVATAAADAGLEAAVCEPGPLGGACVTRGCVPTKALIHRADVREGIRRAGRYGIEAESRDVRYGEVTDAIRDAVSAKAEHQAEALREASNVTLYESAGRFVDERAIELDDGAADGERIRGDQVVIATGGRPVVPPIDVIDEVDYLTSDDALYLDERPDSLIVVGGGYIGVELGYFFAAVGTDVSIVGRSEALLPEEESAASEAVTRSMERRCDVRTGYEVSSVDTADGGAVVSAEPTDGGSSDDEPIEIEAEELLLATGRRPNADELGLEETGVETTDAGHVETDETLETAVDGVWALGDVLPEQPFKHVADYEAEVVSGNVLAASGAGGGEGDGSGAGADASPETVDYEGVPHAVFAAPRVASVGSTEGELADEGVEYDSATVPYGAAPLGAILDEPEAFVKVLAAPDGEILGCHVVGPEAPTLIQEVVTAIRRGGGTVDDVAGTIHVHPALSEVMLAAFDELSDRSFSTAPDWRDVGSI